MTPSQARDPRTPTNDALSAGGPLLDTDAATLPPPPDRRLRPRNVAAAALRDPMARRAIWLTLPFGVQQMLRLLTNIVLARLLAPEMFGVMVLINTFRTGTELLSDLGIGQSVVRSPHAHDQTFLDTAFTVQFLRGVALMVLALLAAVPLSRAYGNPDLAPIVAVVGVTFIFTGLQSPDIFVMQRDMRVGQRGVYDMACTVLQSAITIGLAWWWGNVWALVWGLFFSSLVSTVLTYCFAPFRLPRLTWHPEYSSEIFHFGKWVFLSTAIYFAAMSTDKIYFSAVLPLALVGVYGVSRTFSDMLNALAQRFGSFLVFPKIVELRHKRGEVSATFQRKRRLALAAIGVALAVSLAVSDRLILFLYDKRYHEAAFMLPVLLASAWFAVLGAFGEATLFGLDKPRASAAGNVAKFAILIVGLPLFVPHYGVFAGLIVLMFGEIGRWLALALALRAESLASVRDDVAITVGIAVLAVALKFALGAVGLVPTFQQWWALGAAVHG
ncbi:MAG: oligosaccharide flippase family protein [Sphingomonas sp.]|uniref:oligosaccharide flippase family protein n=1 Tax=Sphingomonas sp. TaxID=28214 RepID=UPI001AD48BB3|nr:oligosaccharide flippase family protein [Sphingomonas sp.]MBN8808848.1 oligosaccharide flippase family protein [Sphingomonas sp.]